MIARTTIAIAATLLTLGLGACSRSADRPPEESQVEEASSPEPLAADTPAIPEPQPTPSATPDTNLIAEAPPAISPAPDEQMMDDATATGMTARASRDEAPAADTAPVEQVERK